MCMVKTLNLFFRKLKAFSIGALCPLVLIILFGLLGYIYSILNSTTELSQIVKSIKFGAGVGIFICVFAPDIILISIEKICPLSDEDEVAMLIGFASIWISSIFLLFRI